MNDQFREEVVTRRNRSIENLMYILANLVMVVCGLYALLMVNVMLSLISAQGFSTGMLFEIVILLFAVASAVLLFLFRDRIKTEYEYTFTNGTMDFARVFNNRKRKSLGTMNIRNVRSESVV